MRRIIYPDPNYSDLGYGAGGGYYDPNYARNFGFEPEYYSNNNAWYSGYERNFGFSQGPSTYYYYAPEATLYYGRRAFAPVRAYYDADYDYYVYDLL